MRKIKIGDKVLIVLGDSRDGGYYITPLMNQQKGKILVVIAVVSHDTLGYVYQFRETGLSCYWTDRWIIPIEDVTVDDLLKLNMTL